MIYERRSNQTVCILKDDKGRSCHGSLKKYMPFAEDFNEPDPGVRQEIVARFGKSRDVVLYKCNFCKTVYSDPLAAGK